MDDHVGLWIGVQDRSAQSGTDIMRLKQGLSAIQFDMKMDEYPAARRACFQVVKAVELRAIAARYRQFR